MRREFIFLLLAIISVSTMWSLLSNVFHMVFIDKMLLDTVIGAVGAGNFSYWQLGHGGPLLVELTSLSGDADLYVADNLRPSYEVDRHNFSAITCGKDIVSIPADFPRPIGIGVFGAWSHAISAYSIHVFLDRSDMNEQMMVFDEGARFDTAEQKEQKPIKKERMEDKPRFMKLLNFLDMIFDTFVL